MLQVLVESRGTRQRRSSWALVSFALHSAIVGVALVLTNSVVQEVRIPETVHFIPYTPPAQPQTTTPTPVSIAAPQALARLSFEIPRIALEMPEDQPTRILGQLLTDLRNTVIGSTVGSDPGRTVAPGGIHTESNVDRMVAPLPGNPSPAYPSRLASAGLEGDVLVRFVVDTAGRVEVASIEILSASHALFGDAVRQWLRQTRYSPAIAADRRVRQLVQQRVGFTLAR